MVWTGRVPAAGTSSGGGPPAGTHRSWHKETRGKLSTVCGTTADNHLLVRRVAGIEPVPEPELPEPQPPEPEPFVDDEPEPFSSPGRFW
jgi:hypothetical protein